MSPLKREFDNAVELPQGKLIWFVKQRRRGLSSAVSFIIFFLVLLFYNEYLNIIVIYLLRLSVRLHRAIFRLIALTGGRGGVQTCAWEASRSSLWRWRAACSGGVPGRASFCCCLKASVTFSCSSPRGDRESQSWPGFINLLVQFTGVLFERTQRRRRVIYVIGAGCRGQEGYMVTFLVWLCITLINQT